MSSPSPRKIFEPRENLNDHDRNTDVAYTATPKLPHSKTDSNATQSTFPKPPGTAFMCFFDELKKQDHDVDYKTAAARFNACSPLERAKWDEAERQDKHRYAVEKKNYKGSYIVKKTRAKKHPLAPRRPPSAFLTYSQQMRKKAKDENPTLTNTDISRLLGQMWAKASDEVKLPFRKRELEEREKYKTAAAAFRLEQSRLDAACRTSHRVIGYQTTDPAMLYRQPQQHNAVTAGATMHGPPSNQRSSAAVASQRHNVVSHTAHGDSFGRDYGYGNSTHHRHASPQEPAATQPTPRSFYPVHTEHNQTSPSGANHMAPAYSGQQTAHRYDYMAPSQQGYSHHTSQGDAYATAAGGAGRHYNTPYQYPYGGAQPSYHHEQQYRQPADQHHSNRHEYEQRGDRSSGPPAYVEVPAIRTGHQEEEAGEDRDSDCLFSGKTQKGGFHCRFE